MKRFLILFSVTILALAGAASASVQQGDTELDFLGGWLSQNAASGGADFDALFLMGRLGYFISDYIQVGGSAFGFWTSTELDVPTSPKVDVDVYGLGGFGRYHFMPANQWVPYIGLQIFWANADLDATDVLGPGAEGDSDGLMWGPMAGLRYELNAYNDFFVEFQYNLWEGDIGDDVLDDGYAILFGLIHQFK